MVTPGPRRDSFLEVTELPWVREGAYAMVAVLRGVGILDDVYEPGGRMSANDVDVADVHDRA